MVELMYQMSLVERSENGASGQRMHCMTVSLEK
jgi:hypothetical protein